MLDRAQRAWPEVADRRKLLYLLACAGAEAIEVFAHESQARPARQREALERATWLIDVELLLTDAAWR